MSNVFGQVASNLTAAQKTASRTNLDLDNVTESRVAGIEGDITELSTANNDRTKAALNATGSAPIYACRAWVTFGGTGTVAITASGNVSSVTDNGIGDYTVNFINPMPDSDYAYSWGLTKHNDRTSTDSVTQNLSSAKTVNSFQILTQKIVSSGTVLVDPAIVTISVFR